jgi:hypothetical protein
MRNILGLSRRYNCSEDFKCISFCNLKSQIKILAINDCRMQISEVIDKQSKHISSEHLWRPANRNNRIATI